MNITTASHFEHKMITANISQLKSIAAFVARYGEYFWFVVTFILFLLLGPFSIIAVVIGLWNLANGEHVKQVAEPVKG